jgi:proton-coupled amino acid transporter
MSLANHHRLPSFFHKKILDVYNASGEREKFPSVLTAAMIFVTFMYLIFGTFGYLFFRDGTSDNLVADNLDGVAADVLRICLSVMMLINYPLNMFPVIRILENAIIGSRRNDWVDTFSRNVFRTMLVGLTVILAMEIPHFGLFASLVSAAIRRYIPS